MAWHGMCRALLLLLCLLAPACSPPAADEAADAALIAADPVMARALHDPLMSDPDLASRNEANAVIGFADSDALPVFAATSDDAQAAREAGRLELLEGGPIPDLPLAREGGRGKVLGPLSSAADLIAALGAPASCVGGLTEDFALAATLPPAAAIPPQAMVVQAGGSDAAPCRIRIIRYHTAAVPDDVLQYHYARSLRAGLNPVRYAKPEAIIAATGPRGETLVVHVRQGRHGLSAADLIYRAP